MTAATTESTLFSDANAKGFLKGVAFGATILPFNHDFLTTEIDEINDRVRLAPLRARGGRNRFIGIGLIWEETDTNNAHRAKIVIHQNAADTEVLAASDIFVTASAAGVVYWIFPEGGITLDDTADDMEATLDFVTTTAATAAVAAANIHGFVIYE
jgi:hypothetical protein